MLLFLTFISFYINSHAFDGLTIIGEGHYERNTDIVYPKLLMQFKYNKGAPFCLLAEYPVYKNKQNIIENNFYEILNYYKRKTGTERAALYEILYPFLDDSKIMQDKTLVTAFKNNIPIYFIDLPNDEQNKLAPYRIELMNKRDLFMFEQIKHLWESKKCKTGLLINGALHITSADPERKTLKMQLKNLNIPVRYFRVYDTLKPSTPLPLEGDWFEYDALIYL